MTLYSNRTCFVSSKSQPLNSSALSIKTREKASFCYLGIVALHLPLFRSSVWNVSLTEADRDVLDEVYTLTDIYINGLHSITF